MNRQRSHRKVMNRRTSLFLCFAMALACLHLAGADPAGLQATAGSFEETPAIGIDLQLGTWEHGVARPCSIIAHTFGGGPATGIVVSAPVPARTTFNAAASDPAWSCSDGAPAGTVCTVDIGDLDSEDFVWTEFAVMVDPDTGPAWEVFPQASLTHTSPPSLVTEPHSHFGSHSAWASAKP